MQAIRKEYHESIRKEQIDEMLLNKRIRILEGLHAPGTRDHSIQNGRSSENALAKFSSLVDAFNHESKEAYPGILDAAKFALNPYSDHLELAAFFESGILRYVMDFYKSPYISSHLYIIPATSIACNLMMGSKAQIDQVLSHNFLNLLTEVLTQLDRGPGSATRDVYTNILWSLANLTGQEYNYRDLVLAHTPLIDAIIRYFDHGGPLLLKEAGAFCWLTSNLGRGPPFPSLSITGRFVERAINQLKRFPENEDIMMNTLHTINDYLSPNLEQTMSRIQARDIIKSNVMKYVVAQLESTKDGLVWLAVRILGHLSVQEDEVIESLIELDWGKSLLRLCLSSDLKIARDSLWVVSNLLNGSVNKMANLDLEQLLEVLTETVLLGKDIPKIEGLNCMKNLIMGANHNTLKRIFNFKGDVGSAFD